MGIIGLRESVLSESEKEEGFSFFFVLRSDPIDLPAPAERENQARLAYCLINSPKCFAYRLS
jgi:hypothetical protein